jgi:hypothetical protein
MPLVLQNSEKYWRERAEELRRLAERLRDPWAKEQMLQIAHTYDQLAQRAAERQTGRKLS